MSNKAIALAATPRTEFGKGAARRARRAGLVPVVVYGPGFEPKHINVDRLEFTAIVRRHGLNTVVNVDIDGAPQLAMIKAVDQNVLTLNIDHADLLAIQRGEQVEVEVPVVAAGEPGPGAMLIQEADTIRVLADVLSIPDEITVDIEGREIGSQIHAADIALPDEVTLADDPELLVLNFVVPETSAAVEPETEAEESSEAASEE